MDTEMVKEALQRSGLTRYESEAYLALLDAGMRPVREIASRCDVPTSQIYDTVRSLEEKGYAELVERNRMHARPVEPVEVMSSLRESGDMLIDAAEEIEDRWEAPQTEDYRINIVNQQRTVTTRAREGVREAERTVDVAARVDRLAELRAALADAHERGVVVRVTIYAEPGIDDRVDDLRLEAVASEVRVRSLPGSFLCIVDRRKTYFCPHDLADENYGVFIRDDVLSFVFHWFFLSCLWFNNERLSTAPDSQFVYVSIEEFMCDFVPLWAEGATIAVEAEGRDRDRNEIRRVTGEVVDFVYEPGPRLDPAPSLDQLAGVAAIVVSVDGERYSIGGWGSVLERMELRRIRVRDVRFPEPTGDPDDAASGRKSTAPGGSGAVDRSR